MSELVAPSSGIPCGWVLIHVRGEVAVKIPRILIANKAEGILAGIYLYAIAICQFDWGLAIDAQYSLVGGMDDDAYCGSFG